MNDPVLELCGCTTDLVTGKPVSLCAECKRELEQPSRFQRAGDVARRIVDALIERAKAPRA